MLKIRMQRIGRRNDPSFRVIVAEHTESPKTGSFVERLGSYNPKTKERVLDADRIKYWMSKGAKASDTMHNMLVSAGIIEGTKINVLPRKSPIKKEEAGDAGAAAAASTSVAAAATPEAKPEETALEAPVEETSVPEAPAAETPAEAPAADTGSADGGSSSE